MEEYVSVAILLDLLKCVATFYISAFIWASICVGIFRLPRFDVRLPFDFVTWVDLAQCCNAYSRTELASLVCLELTYFCCGWLFSALVQCRPWDFILTVTVLHLLLSCAVMQAFPLSWSWWLCLGVAVLVSICTGEMLLYSRRKWRETRQCQPTDE